MALEPIKLLEPVLNEGCPMNQALAARHSSRQFADRPLDMKHLSEILWAAYGINRPDGRRTVPSAYGFYPLEVYAVMQNGVYRYNPEQHSLEPLMEGDYRTLTGHQDFLATAPLDLLFFSDRDKMTHPDPRHNKAIQENMQRIEAFNAAACTQNVYLYCASAGINAVERLLCDGEHFKNLCSLKPSLTYVVAQTIGYPAE